MQAKAGRPKERQGDYERITLEVRRDLLAYLDSKPGSRRDSIEQLVEKDKKTMAIDTRVQISPDWQAPHNSAYGDAGSKRYAGEIGITQAQNTSGETLVKFDDPGLGSYWIEDEDITILTA